MPISSRKKRSIFVLCAIKECLYSLLIATPFKAWSIYQKYNGFSQNSSTKVFLNLAFFHALKDVAINRT